MKLSTDYLDRRTAVVVLLLLTAIILEAVRRVTGYPRLGDVRGILIMAGASLALATGTLLALAFFLHSWPFSG